MDYGDHHWGLYRDYYRDPFRQKHQIPQDVGSMWHFVQLSKEASGIFRRLCRSIRLR